MMSILIPNCYKAKSEHPGYKRKSKALPCLKSLKQRKTLGEHKVEKRQKALEYMYLQESSSFEFLVPMFRSKHTLIISKPYIKVHIHTYKVTKKQKKSHITWPKLIIVFNSLIGNSNGHLLSITK